MDSFPKFPVPPVLSPLYSASTVPIHTNSPIFSYKPKNPAMARLPLLMKGILVTGQCAKKGCTLPADQHSVQAPKKEKSRMDRLQPALFSAVFSRETRIILSVQPFGNGISSRTGSKQVKNAPAAQPELQHWICRYWAWAGAQSAPRPHNGHTVKTL